MNGSEALARFYKEKKLWLSSDVRSDEIRWTVRGIDLCIGHVLTILKERREKEISRKPLISRWLSRDLYQAVTFALNYLKTGDRARGIRTLEKAKEFARGDYDNRVLRQTQRTSN